MWIKIINMLFKEGMIERKINLGLKEKKRKNI